MRYGIILLVVAVFFITCGSDYREVLNSFKSGKCNEARDTLYSTDNIWTLLLLDTKTGQVKQICIKPPISIGVVPMLSSEKTSVVGRYKLYKTENMWNYLLLDTYLGSVYQVQFSLDTTKGARGFMVINEKDLRQDRKSGPRFNLNSTGNMWTFSLLDSYTGDVWIVQFSVDGDPNHRWIQPVLKE